jgi:sugar lactone lactonase YvrE
MLSMFSKAVLCVFSVAACATDGPNGGDDDDIPPEDAPPFTDGVSTLTGHAEASWVDGARGRARFNNPVNVVYGPDGKLYVADFDNSKVRVVDPDTGETSTLITQPNFKRPFAMAFGTDGTLYVTTDCNSTSGTQGPMTGTIWRVDNGVATVLAENMGRPRGMTVLPDGRLAISDYQHHVVQLVDPNSGVASVLAGTWDSAGMVDGAASKFSAPYGMAVLDGKLVVADFDNHRIRTIGLDGTVTTIAGDGTAGFADGATSKLNKPQGVVVAGGSIYFTDLGNFRVRRVVGTTVETVAGTGEGGFLDHDDPLQAQLFGLEGLTARPDGSFVYVADGSRGDAVPYNRVRMIEIQ